MLTMYRTKIRGSVYYGSRTKELIQYIPQGAVALLQHEDIDEMAAIGLIEKRVKAVLNLSPSMSGNYPSLGTSRLIEANIPVFDLVQPGKMREMMEQGDQIIIMDAKLWIRTDHSPRFMTYLTPYTPQYIEYKLKLAKRNLKHSLKMFTENTLHYAQKEINEILHPLQIPPLKVRINGRHAVVVTRGSGYVEDLQAIGPYIKQVNPVLIGVDGGANAILECGYKPDLIIGDMDSVTEKSLRSGAEIVVHAYANGEAPGLNILRQYGLSGKVFPCFGTSEDAAHLLAYEAGASLIVTLGSHTNMVDFLEKGRKGMGSTLLVRLKIGEKLVDAKGVRLLYPETEAKRRTYMSPIYG